MRKALPDIRKVDVKNKRVLVRADLNAPMREGRITDATRLERFAPTLKHLLSRGASVVIMTHLGRPSGERNPLYSTAPIALALSEILARPVRHASDCVGERAESVTGNLQPGEVVLLENLRFHKGESENERNFAIRLSIQGDIYVNDAFSCAHRAHASTHAIAQLMPAYAGPMLINEVRALEAALENPKKPVAALVGGAKVSTKIEVLRNLVLKTDYLIIGGGMANTFLAAKGHAMGQSLVEIDCLPVAREILGLAESTGCKIVLPEDVVVAEKFAAHAPNRVVSVSEIPANMMALDLGPASVDNLTGILLRLKTLLWNGPLGAFEIEPFGAASFAIARTARDLVAKGDLIAIAGGGDTLAALNGAGISDADGKGLTYVSTAGGAFLEWLEGKALPGIEILERQTNKSEVA